MAAISIVPKVFPLQGITPHFIKVTTLTTGDWINVPNCRGVFGGLFSLASSTANEAPDAPTWQYGVALSTAAYATVTTTTIAVDGAGAGAGVLARQLPFFAKCKSGEIIEVTAESDSAAAASTWTIRRGCLGTTPAAIADNDYFNILNQLVFASTRVGTLTGIVFPMPEDAGSKCLA